MEIKPIRVLAADDHPVVRDGIGVLFAHQLDIQLVAEASNGNEAIAQFRKHNPDVTLMDLQMPDMDGIEAIVGIRRYCPHAKIIVLTTYAGDALAQRALRAGAQGYMLKGLVRKDLLDTIRAVNAGKKRIHPEVESRIVQHLGRET